MGSSDSDNGSQRFHMLRLKMLRNGDYYWLTQLRGGVSSIRIILLLKGAVRCCNWCYRWHCKLSLALLLKIGAICFQLSLSHFLSYSTLFSLRLFSLLKLLSLLMRLLDFSFLLFNLFALPLKLLLLFLEQLSFPFKLLFSERLLI